MIMADWLTGTMGIYAYFGMSRLKVTKAQLIQAMKAEDYIKSRAKAWAASKKPAKMEKMPISFKDYDMIVTALQHPYQATPDLSAIPDDLALDVVAKFLDITHYLHEHQPALMISGGLIGREIEPPTSDKTRFCWACNAINDVRIVYDLLDSGALTGIEADAFKTLFPDMAMFTAVSYLKEAINFMYDNEKPTMASWQLQGISALLGVPMADFNDVVSWQMNYDQQGPGRPPSSVPDFATDSMSDMQALNANK